MLKIQDKYVSYITGCLSREFDSLYVFMAVLGMYIRENPEIIEFPKQKLIELAYGTICDDITLNLSQSQIVIGSGTYIKKKTVIDNLYKTAIKLGCIIEKFDDICFSKEEVIDVDIEKIPFFKLQVTDWTWKRRLMFSSEYYTSVMHSRNDKKIYETDVMYAYYKCYVCKKSNVLCIPFEVEQVIQNMLSRQFAAENMFQQLVRYASMPEYRLADIASYCSSLFLLLYIEQRTDIMSRMMPFTSVPSLMLISLFFR